MKKQRMSLLLALMIIIIFTSCTKNYICTCSEKDTTTGKTNRTYTKQGTYTQADAGAWCAADETSGFGIKITCSLK